MSLNRRFQRASKSQGLPAYQNVSVSNEHHNINAPDKYGKDRINFLWLDRRSTIPAAVVAGLTQDNGRLASIAAVFNQIDDAFGARTSAQTCNTEISKSK